MADLIETGLAAGGGGILGAIAAYLGLERRVSHLERREVDYIKRPEYEAHVANVCKLTDSIDAKLDKLIDIHMTDRRVGCKHD